VVVHDLNILGASNRPPKADAVLVVDTDAVLACAIALESLQPIAWRNPEVVEPAGDIELPELAPCDRLEADEALHPNATSQSPSVGVAERNDHGVIITLRVSNGKRDYLMVSERRF
jgi:hypothetical protein